MYTQKKEGFKDQYLLHLKKIKYNTIAGKNVSDGSISGKKPYKRTRFIEDKEYKGKLWCITNKFGTVIVRRNGKVMISGNCGRGIRIAPGKEKVRIIDICGNVERFGKIESFEIVEDKKNMHRLKSDVSFLTGYDFYHNLDIEANNYAGLKETEFKRCDEIIRFGKYKGTHVTKIPNAYLDWAKDNMKGSWQKMFQKEYKRRQYSKNNKNNKQSNELPF